MLGRVLRLSAGAAMGAAFVTLAPLQATAADMRQGSNVTVGPGESVTDDVYAIGGSINIQGTVTGSVIATGGTITVSGNISRDLIAAGGTINVTGKVDGSIRAAGGTITLSGPVGEDVVVAGGTLNVGSGATIGRDLVIGVGTATVAGPVARRVLASAGTLTLQSKVGGDVTAQVDHLSLEPGARIGGKLDYTSNNEVQKASEATVAGTTTRHPRQDASAPGPGTVLLNWLRALIGIFALGLLLLLLFPRFSARTVETLERAPLPSLGIGLGVLVLVPIAALILFVIGLLIGGWWIGLLLIPAWVLACALGFIVSGFFVGRVLVRQFGRMGIHPVWILLGGLVVLTVVGLLPVIGWLVSLAAIVFGVGALIIALSRQRQAAPAAA
jgi:cytoskeletal protein CcmA (bactofilin family)